MHVADLYKCWPETTPTLPLQHILTDTHTHTHTHTHTLSQNLFSEWSKHRIVTGAIRERKNRELEGSFSESAF